VNEVLDSEIATLRETADRLRAERDTAAEQLTNLTQHNATHNFTARDAANIMAERQSSRDTQIALERALEMMETNSQQQTTFEKGFKMLHN
jgi:hypothetical protein